MENKILGPCLRQNSVFCQKFQFFDWLFGSDFSLHCFLDLVKMIWAAYPLNLLLNLSFLAETDSAMTTLGKDKRLNPWWSKGDQGLNLLVGDQILNHRWVLGDWSLNQMSGWWWGDHDLNPHFLWDLWWTCRGFHCRNSFGVTIIAWNFHLT